MYPEIILKKNMVKSFFLVLFFASKLYFAKDVVENYVESVSKIGVDRKSYSLMDFGAVGDGVADDSMAFLKAIENVSKTASKIILIPDNYTFNLSSKTIDFTKYSTNVILKFDGGILINGNLNGNKTKIKADRLKIFENINLFGTFSSFSNYAYPEWFGTFPFDNRLDLVDALKKLDSVFFDIQLGPGDYFTQKGEYEVKGLSGTSLAKSRVIMETDKSNTYLFSLGKIGGGVNDRTYDYNYIKNVTLFITKKKLTSILKGNRGIIIGSVHKPYIENVIIKQSLEYQRFSKKDLQDFLSNEQKLKDANISIEFKGDSELSILRNISSYADVGILFSQYTDMVSINDYFNDCSSYGIANVYFTKEAVQSQNLLFNGTQSWNRGLYGFYSEDSNLWNTFRNSRFENVRIEQLTSELTNKGKVMSTSIRIGKSNLIANLIFENIILSGASNGIYIGETTSGNVYFDKVFLYPDITIKRNFAIKTKMLPPSSSSLETPFQLHLKNIDLYHDAPSVFGNSKAVSSDKNELTQKNIFSDVVISY